MLFMGIDVGTQGARCVVADETGKVHTGHSVAFRSLNATGKPGRYEQVAEDWWQAVSEAVAACTAELRGAGHATDNIAAISVDGTSGTIVPLDSGYRPLCNAFMYNDMRAKEQAARVREVCRNHEKALGFHFNASFSLPRILWVRDNLPELYEKTAVFAHQADYIVGRLSGEYRTSDYSNALKTGYDLLAGRWPESFGGGLGLDTAKLARIVAPGAAIAPVRPEVAEALGLSPRTMVTGGSTDGYASALAAGAIEVGSWASIIGTTFVVKGVTERLVIDPDGSSYSHMLPSGAWMLGGASNIGGRCLNEFAPDGDFDRRNALAEGLVPTGVRSYPLIGKGERFPFVDPDAEAFFSGDLFGGKMYAALMEGIGFVERFTFERMAAMGAPVGNIIHTAGGACRSGLWLRIRASILNRTLKVPETVDAAMGSTMLAAAGSFGSLEKASEAMLRIAGITRPEAGWVRRYDEIYGQFREECGRRYRKSI